MLANWFATTEHLVLSSMPIPILHLNGNFGVNPPSPPRAFLILKRAHGKYFINQKSYKQTLYCHNSLPWLSCWLIPIHTYCLITIMCSCGENSSWGSGGREHGGAPGEVHNKWWWLLLIGSDFNPMLHHCSWWVESSGFRQSVMRLCLQADTIISLIVTSPKQWHQEVIHQSISCDMRRKMTRGPLTYAENLRSFLHDSFYMLQGTYFISNT